MMVAVAAHLRTQQKSLEGLMSAVESSLADVTAAIEGGAERAGEMKDMLASVESTLADVASTIESSGIAKAIESVAEALRAVNPTVTVNVPQQKAPTVNVQVNPTPVTVEAVMPAMPAQPAPVIHIMPAPDQKGATWKVTIPGTGYGASDRVMTITRTA